MKIEELNVRALDTALSALVGTQRAGIIRNLYQLLANAEQQAYGEGQSNGYNDGYQLGHGDGFAFGYESGYDDGKDVVTGGDQPFTELDFTVAQRVITLPDLSAQPIEPEVAHAVSWMDAMPEGHNMIDLEPPYQGDSGDEDPR